MICTQCHQVLSGQAIGRRGALTGQILLDGALPGSDRYRRIGFIDKNDVHIPSMTVAQTLRFSLNTHAVDTLPEALAAYRVGIVMKLLGLAHVADNIIGNQEIRGISGGEKRRVSIGVALVVGHDVILADLPTNGLDSTTALEYIKLNRKISDSLGTAMSVITDQCITIIPSRHSPCFFLFYFVLFRVDLQV